LLTKFFVLDNQSIFDKFDWFWYKSFNNLPIYIYINTTIKQPIKTTQVIQFALFLKLAIWSCNWLQNNSYTI